MNTAHEITDVEIAGTIAEKESFYGYIIGLWVEPEYDPDRRAPSKLYARFEYSGSSRVWLIPDYDLFKVLTSHLADMARMRSCDGYGMEKLWIGKKDGKWVADLP